eukprot:COSAG02_NODE_23915_length_704_cov_0.933884_2_plen_27_part_01
MTSGFDVLPTVSWSVKTAPLRCLHMLP